MKKQRNGKLGVKAEAGKMGMSKKKSKMVVEEIKEEIRKNEREVEAAAAAVTVENVGVGGWEEWCPWISGEADEQMSWGCAWSPYWDVDFVDQAYNSLFSDVAWDDDIWNLKSIKEVPK